MALSTIKSASILDGSLSASDLAAGSVESYLGTQGSAFGFRNRIINGAFEFWQRGTTSRTFALAATYTADRWTRAGYQDAAHALSSVTDAVSGMTARNAIRVSTASTSEASGGSRCDLSQKIESVNCFDLSGQTVTVSFWVRFSSATITPSAGSFNNWNYYLNYNTTTTDSTTFSDLGDGNVFNRQIANGSLPTTWTKITVSGVCPSSLKNLTMRFQFDGLFNTSTAGSQWFEVTEVQLEKGSTATSFEYRPYGVELALCQRYYEIVHFHAWARAGDSLLLGSGTYSVQKRTAPTVTYSKITGSGSGAVNPLVSSNIYYAGCYQVTGASGSDCRYQALANSEL